MSNIKIISFGEKEIYTGFVSKIGEEQIRGEVSIIPAIIWNYTYNSEKKQTEKVSKVIYFTSIHDTLDFARNMKVGQRIHVMTKKNSKEDLFAIKTCGDGSLHWSLSDETSTMNIFYGPSFVKDIEPNRFTKLSCNGEIVTFWNDEGSSKAENAIQAFKNNIRKTFVVTGTKKNFLGKDEYRGYWFICD